MNNPYGLVLDDASLRWAAAESVSEAVIAAIYLLETRSVDEIVARLTPAELEQVSSFSGVLTRVKIDHGTCRYCGSEAGSGPWPIMLNLALCSSLSEA